MWRSTLKIYLHGESWKLDKNGICENCRNYKYSSIRKSKNWQKKKKQIESVRTAAKFSGIYSSEEDMAYDPTTDLPVRHNDMHFRKVPPYLKGLTTTEMALVSKVSVLMNVHSLKTGMFPSQGLVCRIKGEYLTVRGRIIVRMCIIFGDILPI